MVALWYWSVPGRLYLTNSSGLFLYLVNFECERLLLRTMTIIVNYTSLPMNISLTFI